MAFAIENHVLGLMALKSKYPSFYPLPVDVEFRYLCQTNKTWTARWKVIPLHLDFESSVDHASYLAVIQEIFGNLEIRLILGISLVWPMILVISRPAIASIFPSIEVIVP